MWVEGAFNRLSNSHCNSSADLMEAKLDSGMNQHSRDVIVSSTEMNTVAKQQELARTASNKAVDKSDSIAFLMKKPATRRMTADEKAAAQKQAQGEKAAAAEVKAAATKKAQEEKQAVAKAKAAERERQRQEASVQKEALQMERKRIAEQKREAKKAKRIELKRKAENDQIEREKKKAAATQNEPKEDHLQKGKAGRGKGTKQTGAHQAKAKRIDRTGTKRCRDCNTWLLVSLLDSKETCLNGKDCRKRGETGLGKRVSTKKTFD
jgi:hypothetical protein